MPGMIERGARGDSVENLQQALVDAGYDIEVDGIFGEDTENAVIHYQSENGLDADGVVGPNTWRSLGF
jgi:peptidoglycan hydrolase-like protein with peptidoglycan-binding domain